jgi:hypothetical protein
MAADDASRVARRVRLAPFDRNPPRRGWSDANCALPRLKRAPRLDACCLRLRKRFVKLVFPLLLLCRLVGAEETCFDYDAWKQADQRRRPTNRRAAW